MKYFTSSQHWRVVTIASALTAVVVISLITASGVSLYSSYRFDLELAHRSQEIIATSLQKGGLPFAVATQDTGLIESIIETNLQYDEIYAIEIKDAEGNPIHRNEKKLDDSGIKIVPRTLEISSPYESVPLDTLDSPASTPSSLGTITIYYSTEELEQTILNQVIFAGGILLLAISVIGFLLFLFNRLIMRYLDRTVRTMESIERGEKLEWNDSRAPSLHELRVIYESLQRLSTTIFERDARLKVSLQEALDAKVAAEQAEHFKDDFIRAISHDIRTPVGVVVNLLGLIDKESARQELDKSLIDKLSACYQSAQVLNDVTSELFDFDQFQNMELVEHREPVELEALFTRITGMYKCKFEDRGIGFCVKHDNGSSRTPIRRVCLDQKKLTLMIENLIDNALKFTPAGSVTLSWSTADDLLCIRVKDSGIGIPEDKLSVIFDRHTQLQSPITTQHEGRGLGLFYVRRLADAIGATIKVSSKEGIGSVFSVDVPYSAIVQPVNETPAITHEKIQVGAANTPIARSSDSLRVLIIDDDEATCFTLSEMLAQHGIECGTENIPEIGYKRLIEDAPDLVFIDYHMTGLSGDKLAQKAQQILSSNATFFVCITAESNRKSLAMLNEVFQEVYLKPFDPNRLDLILKQVADSKRVTSSILSSLKFN